MCNPTQNAGPRTQSVTVLAAPPEQLHHCGEETLLFTPRPRHSAQRPPRHRRRSETVGTQRSAKSSLDHVQGIARRLAGR